MAEQRLFRSDSSDEDGGNPANIAASGASKSNTAPCASSSKTCCESERLRRFGGKRAAEAGLRQPFRTFGGKRAAEAGLRHPFRTFGGKRAAEAGLPRPFRTFGGKRTLQATLRRLCGGSQTS
jgi:hypothetical protein